jgi:hypothetical protein
MTMAASAAEAGCPNVSDAEFVYTFWSHEGKADLVAELPRGLRHSELNNTELGAYHRLLEHVRAEDPATALLFETYLEIDGYRAPMGMLISGGKEAERFLVRRISSVSGVQSSTRVAASILTNPGRSKWTRPTFPHYETPLRMVEGKLSAERMAKLQLFFEVMNTPMYQWSLGMLTQAKMGLGVNVAELARFADYMPEAFFRKVLAESKAGGLRKLEDPAVSSMVAEVDATVVDFLGLRSEGSQRDREWLADYRPVFESLRPELAAMVLQ